MKVLILTSPPFMSFILQEVLKYRPVDFFVKAFGEYDWSGDYDIGISFMYPYKVPKEQLSKTRINFHPGPLPEYRGRNLCYHALMSGETKFGATVHYMDENFDAGRIIEVSRFPILPNWCADDLSYATFQEAERLFSEYLPRILAGEEFYSVENVGGDYYSKKKISEFVAIPPWVERQIRAISYEKFRPKININGTIFELVRK